MAKRNFFDFFPVPRYLKNRAVGFDISDGSVKFIELIDDSKGFRVGVHGKKEFKFPVEDASNDTESVINVLSEIRKEFNIDTANVSIPEEQAYFLRLKLPKMAKRELRQSIELQLEEHIPYSPNEVIFDYNILSEEKKDDEHINVSVSVLTQAVVNRYSNIFRSAGIAPVAFEIEAESTARSLIPEDDEKTHMIVNVGKINTVLSVVSGKNVWFSYTFKLGGEFFSNTIARCLSISQEEAEKIKFSKGLSRASENQELLFCLAPAISSLRDEIIKHYWYWNSHKGETDGAKEISNIIICGSQSNINGLTDYLSISLGLNVTIGNPWMNLVSFEKYIPEIGAKEANEFSTVIGLAMRNISSKENRNYLLGKNK